MVQDNEGFWIPKINQKKCIHCGKCERVCSYNHPNLNTKKPNNGYAMYTTNADIRANSSSGGIFYLLADEMIRRGGYVCGATYTYDQGCYHIMVDDYYGLEKLRRSKYIQSKVGETFHQTKELLELGKWVLYSGTPCQIMGLKNYLGKEYDRLLTIDLICHGTPSQRVWDAYLADNFPHEKVQHLNFRDKKTGWGNYAVSIKTNKSFVLTPHDYNSFIAGFLKDIYLCNSCYSCPFHSTKRPADITLGDFWGVGRVDETLNDNKGTSLVLLNSDKGRFFLSAINPDLYFVKAYPIDHILPYNLMLRGAPTKKYNRSLFFALMREGGFKYAFNRIVDTSKNVAILNLWHTHNYGAILTAWALQTVLLKMGYNPTLVKNDYWCGKSNWRDVFSDFESELYAIDDLKDSNDLKRLNLYHDNFIVGSDQVWRYLYTWRDYKNYFLSFVNQNKRKIAYAASFGIKEHEGPLGVQQEISNYLKSFCAISVREKSGVDICRDTFSVQAQAVFDPVFLLKTEDWNYLLQKSTVDISKTCLTYFLYEDAVIKKSIERILHEEKLSRSSIKICDTTVYDFLKSIKTAKKIMTDSFHGICFAIIFQKDFICVNYKNQTRGEERLLSLLSDLGLLDRMFYNLEEVDWAKIPPIDYDKVNLIIKQKRTEGLDFLIKALNGPILKR